MTMHSKQIKHAELTINDKWIHARITKFDYSPDTFGDDEYMVVFRNSDGAKDISFYKWESLALEKYQTFLENHFRYYTFNFLSLRKNIENEISSIENSLNDPH